MTPIVMLLCASIYIGFLFWLAWYGDQKRASPFYNKFRHVIFGLSLGVYFTTWSFYGAVGNAIRSGWDYLPIYLGPLLVLLFGYKIIEKMVQLGQQQHTTSIADFLSARYGKSTAVAGLVALIALFGTIPYIALQLKSVTATTTLLISSSGGSVPQEPVLVPIIALIFGGFAILFGTRHADVTEHNRGLVLSISFETAFKIFALITMGVFAFILLQGLELDTAQIEGQSPFSNDIDITRFITLTLLGAGAILCLPRQFHILAVEHQGKKNHTLGRLIFTTSLIIVCIAVIPISLAGFYNGITNQNADFTMLILALSQDRTSMAFLVYLGGLSAGISMVIVSSLALSTMITNDLLLASILSTKYTRHWAEKLVDRRLLYFRRWVILILMLIASVYATGIKADETLASMGILAFAAAIQFAPSLIGGLYWQSGHRNGAIGGLIAGFLLWAYCLMIPAYLGPETIDRLIALSPLLNPYCLFELINSDPLTHGVIWSLGANIVFYIWLSHRASPRILDRLQASSFTGKKHDFNQTSEIQTESTVGDLRVLVERALGTEKMTEAFHSYEKFFNTRLIDTMQVDTDLIRFAENQISKVMGAASARIIVDTALHKGNLGIEDFATILDETHQQLEFSHELLQSTLDNLIQGVAVLNKDLELVAWNKQYLEIFDFPKGMIKVGTPIQDVLRFNATRMGMSDANIAAFIERRVTHYQSRKQHFFERTDTEGRVLKIVGSPMPQGNYVTSFTDISDHRRIENELHKTNETLEHRVDERTEELRNVNDALLRARERAEDATHSKTKFLAAASHDLLQPLNAARLFTQSLKEDIRQIAPDSYEIAEKLDNSINSADKLIRALLDISKLDAGGIKPNITRFALSEILDDLMNDLGVIATQKDIDLRYVETKAVVESDRGLLQSVLQNLIANAVRYTKSGKVLVGCRHQGDAVVIHVYDTGIGIAENKLDEIFEEFERGSNHQENGLGLGLAITDRITQMLGHELAVKSIEGQGTCFSLTLPRIGRQLTAVKTAKRQTIQNFLNGKTILCIDNDPAILDAFEHLLTRWGGTVLVAQNREEAKALFDKQNAPMQDQIPSLVLLDLQLDDGDTGPAVYQMLTEIWTVSPPAILITAERQESALMAQAKDFTILAKPVAPATLRALLQRNLKG